MANRDCNMGRNANDVGHQSPGSRSAPWELRRVFRRKPQRGSTSNGPSAANVLNPVGVPRDVVDDKPRVRFATLGSVVKHRWCSDRLTFVVQHSSARRGFTLVELLVAVSVIAILASLLLGALYVAQDAARAQKTRSTIAKLHTQLMARYEAYKTRRVPITVPAGTRPSIAAMCRLSALREIMRLELPDRGGDIPDSSVTSTTFNCTDGTYTATVVVPRPSLSWSYLRSWSATAAQDSAKGSILHGAECLYLIVTNSVTDDETGREAFGDSEVGDQDNDGRPEFRDGWGNPISFVRWPAGLVSELQPADPATGNRDLITNHDPFDSRRVDAQAFALYPLVFSPGPDGKYEIKNDSSFNYSTNGNGVLNPYSSASPPLIGAWTDQDSDGVNDANDNIHNHLIGTR